ncbi:formate dehydrogenase accessory protein FdhE [Ectothiorhodospira shaposhnikovii]|uniref:formate dehydrogenase accessory protein FdhE n=1 Tax=Ectothiorhodospira shaposhnikovii TaxID=1054 RepID=UPI001908C27F|nr:formate dehydrogenase accessory protein FdhE [Ectothiorhodospira shaposhnikovii]MBK1674956.1 formate dehydrogenase accessory protein FdhE [Ectothiorhodospira shaposhnikovii]
MTDILRPGEIQGPGTPPPFLKLPDPGSLFTRRAERFQVLAQDHPVEAFLLFMAALAQAQHRLVETLTGTAPDTLPRPTPRGLPFPAADLPDIRHWQPGLRSLLEEIEPSAPAPTRAAIRRLRSMSGPDLVAMAREILGGHGSAPDPAAAPLLAAALQAHWSVWVGQTAMEDIPAQTEATHCPVCGSAPVAGVIHSGGGAHGRRTLHCSLCQTQWHLERLKCSHCHATTDLEYPGLEDHHPGVRAEVCGHCHSYLKLISLETDPRADPVADHLATLTLDLLLGEEGYAPNGINLLLYLEEAPATTP